MMRQRWLPQNLYLRVLLAMVASIATVLTVVTALTIAVSQERLKGEMLAHAQYYSHILTHAASVYVAQQDTHQLLMTAQAATDERQVQFIAFFDQGGELLTAAAAPNAEAAMRASFDELPRQAQAQQQSIVRWSDDSLELAQPIVYQGQPVGTVALRIDTSSLEASFNWEVLHNVVIAVTLVVSISIVVGLLLHQLVIAPLRRLSATADQISAGRWAVPPGQERTDELGRVARSFSKMVSVLQARETQVTLFVRTDGRIIEANRAAVAAYGYDREALLNRNILDLQVTGYAGEIVEQLRRGPVEGLVFEEAHRRSDGSTFPVEVTARSAVIDGQQVIISDIRDITERRQAEAALVAERTLLAQRVEERTADLSAANARLARALRLKDEFLAMMSHELRTPLNAILGITEALDEELYGPIGARQRQALTTVTQSGRHLLAILSDILDLTRIEAGNETLDPRAVNVESLCRSTLQLVQSAAQQKDIRTHCKLVSEVVSVHADERRLIQILANLLDNAVKFTPAGGAIGLNVDADAARERIQFCVWDTGIGIAEAEVDRLFQPFTQVDGRLARKYGGIGLGLTLVRRLVDLHGGSVSLESTPGQGSSFTVSLPWSAAENIAPVARELEARPTGWSRPPRVVIADDHEITLSFYADLLTGQGCRVAAARTGDEALAQVWATRPDVVVMDIQMPGMDGLTAIRHIRGEPELAAVPIIALTALTMPGDRERCLAAGANVYLAKPVSLRTLLAVITELLLPVAAGGDLVGG
ncbi:MAG: response regulator [Chloroflexales bacterium]|nr:response regulator [Chloroflexales bacterium]